MLRARQRNPDFSKILSHYTSTVESMEKTLRDRVDQESSPPVLDYFTAGAEAHRDYGHPGGIRLCRNKSESLGDGVQMEQCSRAGKQVVLACYARRSDVSDLPIKMGFHLLPEVDFVLDDACDQQRRADQVGNLDCQMNTLVKVNPAKEDQVITARVLKRVHREINPIYRQCT